MALSDNQGGQAAVTVALLTQAGWRDTLVSLRAQGQAAPTVDAVLERESRLGHLVVQHVEREQLLHLHLLDASGTGLDFVLRPGDRLVPALEALIRIQDRIDAANFRTELRQLLRACPGLALAHDGDLYPLDEAALAELPDLGSEPPSTGEQLGPAAATEAFRTALGRGGWTRGADADSFERQTRLSLSARLEAERRIVELDVHSFDHSRVMHLVIFYEDRLEELLGRIVRLGEEIDASNWKEHLGPIVRDFQVEPLWELGWTEAELRKPIR